MACIDVSAYTGFPEIMDGRVKTLHPKIHGGIMAVRGNAEHAAAMAENGIGEIDLVVMNLYAFEATVAKGSNFEVRRGKAGALGPGRVQGVGARLRRALP